MKIPLISLLILLLLAGCAETPSAIRVAVNPSLHQSVVHETGGYTFNPYTGEYSGAEPAYATERRKQFEKYRYDQALSWMRGHYIAGKTIMTDRGDMIITENGVQRIVVNPYRDHTNVEPGPDTGSEHQPDDYGDDDQDIDR